MVFSSLEFLTLFLPAFLLLYWIVPQRFRNALLLVGSLVFYLLGTLDHPVYVLLLIAAVLVNYGAALMMERSARPKAWLIAGIVYNFGWLFVFKYADFLFTGINQVLLALFPSGTVRIPLLELLLPIGISFYAFQAVSYLVDVYRRTYPAERSLLRFGTYLCMFPKLASGPITDYAEVRGQLQSRTVSLNGAVSGMKTFIFGMGLKVLLANRIGGLWTDVTTIGFDSISTPLAWMSIFAYSFQLYFDFFGYSLMAIGLGKMLGFRLPQNFRHPYLSLSMTEFWRRWHITLGSWFRDYVYIPLGGSREGQGKTMRNLLVVWLCTGLWHGAHLNFLLWGLVLFAIIALEKLGLKRTLDRHPAFGHLYMLLLIPLSWAVFAVTDLSQLGMLFGRLFPFFQRGVEVVFQQDYLKYAKTYGLWLALGFLFSTKLPYRLYARCKSNVIGAVFLVLVFAASVYCMYMGMNDPFLYFRF